MTKQTGADAHGPVGSAGPRGATTEWYAKNQDQDKPVFNEAKAARDAARNQGKAN